MNEILTTKKIGQRVKARRKGLGLTQGELAMTSGTGIRFISDLENGKDTCQAGKMLRVLHTLGIPFIIGEDKEQTR